MEYNGPPVDTMTTFVSRYYALERDLNPYIRYTVIYQFKYADYSLAWVFVFHLLSINIISTTISRQKYVKKLPNLNLTDFN
jgi:hypothetical protein